ncbi:hypothetical protein HDA32_005380 [Spinactinospora alkalitolerans]|uniref:Uncharacterized protein n=1 Tax=Spinactinospora alkalitolerans TaxID=687207 RepID=A0A852U8K8_9ACTN|nr:hypothetical protein [Spinactinospora alkalitolerans]NYE50260.1 hypothetical protein [Spinactinospora alkalitolerans]
MGVADTDHAVMDEPARPWWVRLSRWLNGTRVCAVGDCIELTDPDCGHCASHIRELRARLGGRGCAEPRCVEPRCDGDPLCPRHREAALIDACVASVPDGRWNV